MEVKNKRQKQAAETKEKIFQNAMNLFTEKPYEEVGVKEIADAANVSVGAFYHHFKNKESILNEGYKLFDERLETIWLEGHPLDNLEAIYFLIANQMKSIEAMGVLATSQYFKNQMQNEDKYILDKNRFFYLTIYNLIEKEKAKYDIKTDSEIITDDILSLSRGIIYDWCLHDGQYNLQEKSKRAMQMILAYYLDK